MNDEAADIAAAHGYALVSMVREHDPVTVDAYLDTIDPAMSRPVRNVILALAAMVDPDVEDPLGWTEEFAQARPILGSREFPDELSEHKSEHLELLEAIENGTKAGRSAAELAVVLGVSQRHIVRLRKELVAVA